MELDRRNLPAQVLARLGAEFLTSRHRGFDLDFKGDVVEDRVYQGRLEARTADDGSPILVGYATVYDAPYDVMGGPPYGWTETIAAGACDKSAREAMANLKSDGGVYHFFDHVGLGLASTKDQTLTLVSDQVGLYNESRVDPTSPSNMEVVRRVQSGMLDAQSFAFQVLRQEWNGEYTERRILEVKLFDVSTVSFPANPFTSVMARDESQTLEVKGAFPLALALHQADALRLALR